MRWSAISRSARIALVPYLQGVGGMVSFQHKLAAGLAARGIETTHDLAEDHLDAVLVIGGTRQLGGLWRARRQGIPVVQRLNGMNWIHRLHRTGLRHYLRSEYGNLLLSWIRRHLANHIVYQSQFSKRWWEGVYGPVTASTSVVYNGVDLQRYTPYGPDERPSDRIRILLVEGSLMGGYETGLEVAVSLAGRLQERLASSQCRGDIRHKPVELQIVGRVATEVKQRWTAKSPVSLQWAGLLAGDLIPAVDRSAHLLYSADINAACPNSVIEALACGLPVVAYDTGALPELVLGESGRIVPYGTDPWKLDAPDLPGLVEAAYQVIADQDAFRQAARQRAEAQFGLDEMVAGYLQSLLPGWQDPKELIHEGSENSYDSK